MLNAVYFVPAFPLLGFLILCLGGSRLKDPWAGWVATLMAGGSALASIVLFFGLQQQHQREVGAHTKIVFDWIPTLHVNIAFNVDPLSVAMALFVTSVGSLIHLYSIGYMHGDERFPRFFVYLNLFLFSMLMLVLADSFLVLFLGWEGVGACSYLLISFWFEKAAPPPAGKKAFIVNRVGDVGFMLAMFLVFKNVGSLTFHEALGFHFSPYTATAIVVCAFVGCVGKSAQLPLYLWLPDAMEGPTPVSALIHAATMVTAGVYLMCRISPITAQAYHWAPVMIAWIGGLTALFAATIACAQDDIKRVLAYSTISQLGYMFLAVGVGAYSASVFHMVTHAFFKALLFLGAGAVIHALHEEQDMKKMGSLATTMPWTTLTFLVGALALGGFPGFSGFFSKDDILLAVWHNNRALWVIGTLTALLTAYYMGRQVQLVFLGEERWRQTEHPEVPETTAAEEGEKGQVTSPEPVAHGHGAEPHDPHWTMMLPLLLLAGGAAGAGILSLPFGKSWELVGHWIEPAVAHLPHTSASTGGRWILLAIAGGIAIVGLVIGIGVWMRGADQPQLEPEVLRHAWFVDEKVSDFMAGPGRRFADGCAWFDAHVVDGIFMGTAWVVGQVGTRLRTLQTGYVRNYALGIAAGAVLLLGYALAVK